MRKPKSEKRKRTVLFLGMRWLPEEHKQVADSAKAAGLSASTFMRRCALRRRITPKGDINQMKGILELGAQQRQLYFEMQKDGKLTPELGKQFSDTLIAIQVAVIKYGSTFRP